MTDVSIVGVLASSCGESEPPRSLYSARAEGTKVGNPLAVSTLKAMSARNTAAIGFEIMMMVVMCFAMKHKILQYDVIE